MRPAGEARFANVRKLMRLAAEFEGREGRDLRGLLDFLAARAESDAEAQAATAAEGHDGVRIMTVHNAKGLEFDVVAVPDLSRSLLAGARPPLLALGREQPPRVGMQLRRLGSGAVNLYDYAALCEEAKERDAEEGLRLFHVAATRARERLILSGVVKPEPGRGIKPSTPVVERLVEALGVERDADSSVLAPAPEPRPGLDAAFDPAEIAVRVNLPSPERAARAAGDPARPGRRPGARGRPAAPGRAPAADRPQPPPLLHRDLRLRGVLLPLLHGAGAGPRRLRTQSLPAWRGQVRPGQRSRPGAPPSAREERTAQGAAVHALLEWSQANGWSEPSEELARRHAVAAGLDPDRTDAAALLAPVRGWLGSALRERIGADATRVRAEVPILLGVGGTVLRGSIDLLVERDGEPPLVVDYKTDRLDGSSPERARRALRDPALDLRPGRGRVAAGGGGRGRLRLPRATRRAGPHPARPGRDGRRPRAAGRRRSPGSAAASSRSPARAERSWALCRGCPALGRLCSGPGED